jgi:hypothetical protein
VVESYGQGELSRLKSGRGRERHAQPADLVSPARRAANWTRRRCAGATSPR